MTAPSSPALPRAAVMHGGDLHRAIARYGRPRERWLDLSTGVNPTAYPVSMPPADIWRTLPDDHDDLALVAGEYYGCPARHILPVAGSQAVIRALPGVLDTRMREETGRDVRRSSLGDAAVATLTYGEYAPAFAAAGVRVHAYDPADPAPLDRLPDSVRYLVVVNPNNPTTDRHPRARLREWQARLAQRGGALIVDEAFADADGQGSLYGDSRESASTFEIGPIGGTAGGAESAGDTEALPESSLIVLRSVGKFFGLAGIRVGFVLAAPALCEALRIHLGAWTVSGPARHAAREALRDTHWQTTMRHTLEAQRHALHAMLMAQGFPARSTPLFAWWPSADGFVLQERLAAEHGIWIRCFAAPAVPLVPHGRDAAFPTTPALPSVRIGLPGSPEALARLEYALRAIGESALPIRDTLA